MNKPILSESLNLIRFDFENSVVIELHHLSDSGKAEIWTWHLNATGNTLIDLSELNLLAPRSRDEFCKRLKARTPGIKDFDWSMAFDYIVPMALQAKRKGEPVIELGLPDKDIVKPSWDAFPLVVSGMPNILFGDRGSLKSKLGLVLALIMILPWDDNTLGIIAPKKHLNVMKLDYEGTQDADEYEWRRLLRGLDYEGGIQLKYRACRRPLADDIEAISDHADAIKADVIIVDSLGAAIGGDLNLTEPALQFNTAIRQLNRTTLITAHTAKNQLGKRSVFGSVFYENLARNIWEVTKSEDEASEATIQHIALNQTKSPPFAPHHKPIAFQFDFDQESERTIVSKYNPDDIDNFVKNLSTNQLILNCLKEGMKTDKAISDEMGKPLQHIRVGLARLKAKKKIVKIGDIWGLISHE